MAIFSFGSKKQVHPLDSAKAAAEWHAAMVREFGAEAYGQVVDLLTQFNAQSEDLTPTVLTALMALDELNYPQHEQQCAQYLMNARMPKALEGQLRARILGGGRQVLAAYQRFMSFDPDSEDAVSIRLQLPQMIARMMYYLSEFARWQFYRHFSPDEMFWRNVNQLFAYAEEHGIDTVPVQLFGRATATTIHDQYLALLMTALLSSGNLAARQLSFAHQLALLMSNRMTLGQDYQAEVSFQINLAAGAGPNRPRGTQSGGKWRVWSTAEFVEELELWTVLMETGTVPAELKPIMVPGVDAELLRYLLREWAVRPHVYQRAERVRIDSTQIEVVQRLPALHKVIRDLEEREREDNRKQGIDDPGFDTAEQVRIYGFVTSRRREKNPVYAPAVEQFPIWDLDNKSATGLGALLPAQGNEWVALGGLLGFRDRGEKEWSLGVIRRLQRPKPDQIYLGVQTLTNRPVAAALRQDEGRSVDPGLSPEMVWNHGEIALFVPFMKDGRKLNTVLISVASYTLGKQLQMVAKGKNFMIRLGKVVERGSDWCQVEVDLVR